MIKSIYQSLSLYLLIFLLFSLSSAHNKTKQDPPSSSATNYAGCFPKVYAFGDSDTDKGNCNFLEAHLKNEVNFNISARLVVDFLCSGLSLPSPCPYKTSSSSSSGNFSSGINFAVSGSTSLEPTDFFGPNNLSSLFWKGVPMSFKTQSDWFNEYLQGQAKDGKKADVANALFWVGQFGVSDYMSSQGSSISVQAISKSSVKNVCDILTTIISSGAKYIVVQGLPPVGCFPCFMSSGPKHGLDKMGCLSAINAGVSAHNEILQLALERFRKMHPHCTIVYADYWNAYLTIANNLTKYGMEEPFKACCGCGEGQFNFDKNNICGSPGTSVCKDPHKYVSWDGIRLTEAMHKHLANLFLHQGFCQPSFDELVKKKKNM
ncbi:GDSL esterase/lipase [Striga asiatica]|uniref:GDSL esterase/lipase n=1 Tax=Striga asiatica TaxID=4170 RepID=A0A5A7NY17_STRAF|nr:GDSL esterase/lipase [Striga asiatica]